MRPVDDSVTVWTIGHSTLPIADFLEMLAAHQIRLLVDIRRFPGSRRHPAFGRDALAAALGKAGIRYVHFPDLGGRRTPNPDSTNTAWRNSSFRGYADYADTPLFRQELSRLVELARSERTAIMCAEAVWWRCHRSIVSDYLTSYGHQVLHIGSNAAAKPHSYTSAARIIDGRLSYKGDPSLGL
jgi:uncharacterized protein (DUF488 family)